MYLHTIVGYYNISSKESNFQVAGLKVKVTGYLDFVIALAHAFVTGLDGVYIGGPGVWGSLVIALARLSLGNLAQAVLVAHKTP